MEIDMKQVSPAVKEAGKKFALEGGLFISEDMKQPVFLNFLNQNLMTKDGILTVNQHELRYLSQQKFGSNANEFLDFVNRLGNKDELKAFSIQVEGQNASAKKDMDNSKPYTPKNSEFTEHLKRTFEKYDSYTYGLGHKGANGKIDCSGFIEKCLTEYNPFEPNSAEAREWAKLGARTTSEGYFTRLAAVAGKLSDLSDKSLQERLEALKGLSSGSIVSIDTGRTRFDAGRQFGIDHIVTVEQDPVTGKTYILESRSGAGVTRTEAEEWLKRLDKKIDHIYTVDRADVETAIARGAKVSSQADARIVKREMDGIAMANFGDQGYGVSERKWFIDSTDTSKYPTPEDAKNYFVEQYKKHYGSTKGAEAEQTYDKMQSSYFKTLAKETGGVEPGDNDEILNLIVDLIFKAYEKHAGLALAEARNERNNETNLADAGIKNGRTSADGNQIVRLVAMPGTYSPDTPMFMNEKGSVFIKGKDQNGNNVDLYTGIERDPNTGRIRPGDPMDRIKTFLAQNDSQNALKEEKALAKATSNHEKTVPSYSAEEITRFRQGSAGMDKNGAIVSKEVDDKNAKVLADSSAFKPENALYSIDKRNGTVCIDPGACKSHGEFILAAKDANEQFAKSNPPMRFDQDTHETLATYLKEFEQLKRKLVSRGVDGIDEKALLAIPADKLQEQIIRTYSLYVPLRELALTNPPLDQKAWEKDALYYSSAQGKDVSKELKESEISDPATKMLAGVLKQSAEARMEEIYATKDKKGGDFSFG